MNRTTTRTTETIALLSAVLVGCVAGEDPGRASGALQMPDDPAGPRADDLLVEEALERTLALSQDPMLRDEIDFLVGVGVETPVEELERIAQLGPESPELEASLMALGLDPHERLARAIDFGDHPSLDGVGDEERGLLLEGATVLLVSADVRINGSDYGLRDVSGGFLITDPSCQAECNRAHLREVVEIHADYARALDDCDDMLCALGAMYEWTRDMRDAKRAQDACVAECDRVDYYDITCDSDSDCPADQFCHRRGLNECRARFSQNKLCTRSAQCLSNCCKPHYSRGFLPICRPANRCD